MLELNCFCLGLRMTWLVLFIFTESLLHFSQTSIFWSSSLSTDFKQSSAKSTGSVNSETLGRSFMYIINNWGPIKSNVEGHHSWWFALESKLDWIGQITGGKKSSFQTTAEPRHVYHSAPIWQTRFEGRGCRMLWKDVGKHPPLFRVGRLQKQFYIQNELARAMSSDTSELQTDSGKVHRVYRQILPRDCLWLFRKFLKN